MYLGEYFLGEWVEIPVWCRAADGTETAPDAAPSLTIFKANDTPVTNHDGLTMPPLAEGKVTGLFQRDVQLGSNFSAGRYIVLVEYEVSSSAKADVHFFRVMAGGNASGAYVAMHYYPRPHGKYIVGQLDDGTLEQRRGPKL